MKVVVSITVELGGGVSRAGFTLYDTNGDVLGSEASSGANVAKRSPEQLLKRLLSQAEHLAADVDDSMADAEPY